MGLRQASSFIKGQWLSSASREVVPIKNPYSQEILGEQVLANVQDVEEALQAAYEAKQEVAALPGHQRSKILKRAAQMLADKRKCFAELISMELGKPLKNTLDEVNRSIETLEISAEEAKRLYGETLPGDASVRGTGTMAFTIRVPVGVVAAITPFNAPLNLVCHKLGPAFASGNSTILKPAPQTTLIATELLKLLLEAGLPPSAVQMVLGGVACGQQIVQDQRVNVISFTGGVAAAQNICQLAGMKKVLLELGGNAATLVHEDANIPQAAEQCARTGFSNTGQSCISVQRIYVHKHVVTSFINHLKEAVSKLKVGNPLDPLTDVGTLVDEKAAKRIKSWIDEALEMGAELIYGGRQTGTVVQPTILFNPPRQCKVVCEEVFGPVVVILPYETIADAIQEVNLSSYGLQAGIFTNQLDVAYQFALKAEVGGVVLNGTSNFRLDHWPYGGIKQSGIGREGPRYAIDEMTETKMIVIKTPALKMDFDELKRTYDL